MYQRCKKFHFMVRTGRKYSPPVASSVKYFWPISTWLCWVAETWLHDGCQDIGPSIGPSIDLLQGPLTRYIKLWVVHAPRMPGTFSPPPTSKETMHHGMCVAHVPWCMSGSLTRGGGGNVPGIPGACTTRNFTFLLRGPLSLEGFSGLFSISKW